MLHNYGAGQSTLKGEHAMARSMVRDGDRQPAIREFMDRASRPGDSHLTRNFLKWTKYLYGLAIPLYKFKVQVTALRHVVVHVIEPHYLLHHIYKHSPAQFEASFTDLGNEDALLEFWQLYLEQPCGKYHKFAKSCTPEELRCLLPLIWHVDGAEVHRNIEYHFWTYMSVVASGNIWDIKFPLTAVDARSVRDKEAFRVVNAEITRYIGWSLTILQSNKLPDQHFLGEPLSPHLQTLAGQDVTAAFSAAYAGLRTDGKARKLVHEFSRGYSSTFCCDLDYAVQAFPNAPMEFFYAVFFR